MTNALPASVWKPRPTDRSSPEARLREALGIRQGDFAIRCGFTPSFLSHVESGAKQPSPAKAREIANRTLRAYLFDTLERWLATSPRIDDRPMEDVATDVVRDRLGQYPADTPIAVVYVDLFGTPA